MVRVNLLRDTNYQGKRTPGNFDVTMERTEAVEKTAEQMFVSAVLWMFGEFVISSKGN